MDECDLWCGRSRENRAGCAVAFLAVNARHVDRSAAFWHDGVPDPLLPALFPLEIAGGRDDAAALGHAFLQYSS